MKKQKKETRTDAVIYEDESIKRCPCCRGRALVYVLPLAIGKYSVTCSSCGLSTRWCKTVAEAKMLWNYRGE